MKDVTYGNAGSQGRSIRLGDWAEIAKPQWALLLELDRYDRNERNVPAHRRAARATAKAIIEGRRRWPKELLPWKTWRELTFYNGAGKCTRGEPPWCDIINLTTPQREREAAEDRAFEKRAALIMAGKLPDETGVEFDARLDRDAPHPNGISAMRAWLIKILR